MKTSNKLLVAATTLIIIYLVAYDMTIKAEYLKGDYKSRFYQLDKLSLTGFDGIENNVANTAKLTVEQGPKFGIWLDKKAKDDLVLTTHNKTLSINYKAGVKHEQYQSYDIHIICPGLNRVSTGYKSLTGLYGAGNAMTTINGFNQDSMNLSIANNSFITLTQNKINNFTANIHSGLLSLTQTNTINGGDFDIENDGSLTVLDADIKNVTYHFADQATISLSGRALHLFKK
jgi:hypothetical protein